MVVSCAYFFIAANLRTLDEEMRLLPRFEVTLQYEKSEIFSKIIDFSQGRVIRPEHLQADFAELDDTFSHITFPQYNGANPSGKTVMDGFASGCAIVTDTLNGDLVLKRRSKVQVFYINSNEEVVKIEQNVETRIFSYLKYMEDMLQYKSLFGTSKPPRCEVMIVIGTRPKTASSRTLVSLNLKPILKDRLNERIGCAENSLSLLFSSEHALQSLHENIVNMNSTKELF